jgi:hypothetical protein
VQIEGGGISSEGRYPSKSPTFRGSRRFLPLNLINEFLKWNTGTEVTQISKQP